MLTDSKYAIVRLTPLGTDREVKVGLEKIRMELTEERIFELCYSAIVYNKVGALSDCCDYWGLDRCVAEIWSRLHLWI